MRSPMKTSTRQASKTSLALIALALLSSCATTKTPPPIVDQGAIGDADVPQVVTHKPGHGPYRDPLVSTGASKSSAQTSEAVAPAQNQAPVVMADNSPQPAAATGQGGLYASHAQPANDSATTNSIVPGGMPARSIQATVSSVYSVQRPLEQQTQIQPAEAPAPVTQQTRPPSKAEILAGLAPDPRKRAPGRQIVPPVVPGQMTPAMAAQTNPATIAQLQGSIPTASPASADSSAASQMEQIQGNPQAQGMTRDSFIKKFLSKLRK